jgi:hypothetical protein
LGLKFNRVVAFLLQSTARFGFRPPAHVCCIVIFSISRLVTFPLRKRTFFLTALLPFPCTTYVLLFFLVSFCCLFLVNNWVRKVISFENLRRCSVATSLFQLALEIRQPFREKAGSQARSNGKRELLEYPWALFRATV